jgi:hypothetical protein
MEEVRCYPKRADGGGTMDLTEATGRYGGDEDGGAVVRSQRRAVADGRWRLRRAPASSSEEGGGE